MELISITQARVVALIEFQQWDPFGKALTLETIAKMGGRYSFTKIPQKLEEIDLQKGIQLDQGRLGEIQIDKITILMNGIIIDTRSSTVDSEKVLTDLIDLAHEAFGAVIKPVRQHFGSQILFRSRMRLAALNPILPKIADTLTERTSADLKHPFTFEPSAVLLSVDTSQAKVAPSMFSIERRVDIPFAENTYFSNAPLRTQEHIELVKAFEESLLAG